MTKEQQLDHVNAIWCNYASLVTPDHLIRFTGFKCDFNRETLELFLDRGFVAQWLDQRNRATNGPFFYVNIPNLTGGQYKPEDSFAIGTERVFIHTPADEIKRLIDEGLHKLLDLTR